MEILPFENQQQSFLYHNSTINDFNKSEFFFSLLELN